MGTMRIFQPDSYDIDPELYKYARIHNDKNQKKEIMNHQQNRQISQAYDNHYCFLAGEDSKFDELIRWDDESEDEQEDIPEEMDDIDEEAMEFLDELEMGNDNNDNNSVLDPDTKTDISLAEKSDISDMGNVVYRHDTSDNTSVAPS